jgi:hypothetical protein
MASGCIASHRSGGILQEGDFCIGHTIDQTTVRSNKVSSKVKASPS